MKYLPLLLPVFIAGCQIHKPVAVDHIETVSNPSVSSRATNQKPSIFHQPVALQGQSPGPVANASTPVWTPIDIQPLGMEQPMIAAPTQPMSEYQFQPNPKAKAEAEAKKQMQASKARAKPGQSSEPVVYGAQLDQYDWDADNTGVGGGAQSDYRVKKGDTFYSIARQHGLSVPVSYTHLRAHETKANLVCRLLLEKKK